VTEFSEIQVANIADFDKEGHFKNTSTDLDLTFVKKIKNL